MAPNFDFPPNAARARLLDVRMRAQLADSLDYLDTVLEGALSGLVSAMRAGQIYPPSTFGLYYELASALMQEQPERAQSLLAELLNELPMQTQGINIVTLDEIAQPANRARYQRLMDTDPDMPFSIYSPPPEQISHAKKLVQGVMARLHTELPQLAGEIEAIIRELVLVVGDSGDGGGFAGGSCYMLWGALFINAQEHAHEMAMIEALAHESAHSLLFGFTIDEPLVKNPDDELFTSPLRLDPRPMDGIYHATFVSARMHWALSKMLTSASLSDAERAWTEQAIARDCESFYQGNQMVQHHASLSPTGLALMQAARAYMQPHGQKMGLA